MKIVNFIQLILIPFFWSYGKFRQVYSFFKSKSDEKRYSQEQKKYEEKSKRYHEEEQRKQDKYEQQQQEQQRRYNQQQEQREREKQQKYKEEKKQEAYKSYSRWDSSNPHEVLGIDKTASSSEIKKAYRNLSKVYHPDMTLTKKEEYLIIFQKINSAYEKLKK